MWELLRSCTSPAGDYREEMKMKKKIAAAALVMGGLLTMTGCSETFSFEADPQGGSGDNYKGDPSKIECFTIEADSSSSDDGDVNLGTFCKKDS